ncbi:MAG: hypothetical protein ABSG43_26855, partial [Solirubrobacteraceae bacterium]
EAGLLFDFGDEWRVLLTLKTTRADDGRRYPLVLAAVGDAPPQYPGETGEFAPGLPQVDGRDASRGPRACAVPRSSAPGALHDDQVARALSPRQDDR